MDENMENVPPFLMTTESDSMEINVVRPGSMEPRIQRIPSSDEESSDDESNECSETEDPPICVMQLSQPSLMVTPPLDDREMLLGREERIQEKGSMFPASTSRIVGTQNIACGNSMRSNIILPHRALLRIAESASTSNNGKFIRLSRTSRRSSIADLIIQMKQLRISPRKTSNKPIEICSVENEGVQAKQTLGVLSNATKQSTPNQSLARSSDGQIRQFRNSSSKTVMENITHLTHGSFVSGVVNKVAIDSNDTNRQRLIGRSETEVTTKGTSVTTDPVVPEGCSFLRFERPDLSEIVASNNPEITYSSSQLDDDVFFSPNFKGETIANAIAAQKSEVVKVPRQISSCAFPFAGRQKTQCLTAPPFISSRRLSISPLKRTLDRADSSEERGVKVLKKSKSYLDLETGEETTTVFRSRSLSPRVALASTISRKVSESSPLSRKRKISVSNSENLTRSERSSNVSDSISPEKVGRYSL